MKCDIINLAILFFLLSKLISAQESDFAIFNNLTNKEWKAEGKWGDGTIFKQETVFKFDLNNTIVIVKSKGFTDKKQTQYGSRNHGIRKFDSTTNTIKFWEFDTFGGLTKGTVLKEGKNILYKYQYGDSLLTDMWEYVDDNTYNFKVGTYVDGNWKQIYLETQFRATKSQKK